MARQLLTSSVRPSLHVSWFVSAPLSQVRTSSPETPLTRACEDGDTTRSELDSRSREWSSSSMQSSYAERARVSMAAPAMAEAPWMAAPTRWSVMLTETCTRSRSPAASSAPGKSSSDLTHRAGYRVRPHALEMAWLGARRRAGETDGIRPRKNSATETPEAASRRTAMRASQSNTRLRVLGASRLGSRSETEGIDSDDPSRP
ncbi:hypothetical protein MUK42_32858 [Musa troglodytarum]|uniref:Uncharacterized protein n=1 Tax=Musa troglodytarum TaxID=320322 RepID=A0A9E7I7W2_9LILI|nr:hypothetical protein MUK42_32858 [Musa troglodytarum]